MKADIQASVKATVLEPGARSFPNKPPNEVELKQAIREALATRRAVSTS